MTTVTKTEQTQKHKLTAADILTVCRMAGTLVLVVLRPFSTAFFVIYAVAGLTDVLDGWIARRTKTAGSFGARLDSVADLLFYAVVLIRLFPYLWDRLPRDIWYAVALLVAIRLVTYAVAAVKYRRFAASHTYLNKATGFAVFWLPFGLMTRYAVGYCWGSCTVAAIAAVEELAIHLVSKDYKPDTKSIFGR